MKKILILVMALSCAGKSEIAHTQLANPSATYCIEKGHKYVMRKNKDGSEDGICVFKYGKCEAWSYFRGECKEGKKKNIKDKN